MEQITNLEEAKDRRKYVRLKTFLPVEFTIVRLQGDLPGINWLKGETRDVSRGGLCLETIALEESTILFLNKEKIYLECRVHMPKGQPDVKIVGEVAWYSKVGEKQTDYTIGLKFRSIIPSDLEKILHHAAKCDKPH